MYNLHVIRFLYEYWSKLSDFFISWIRIGVFFLNLSKSLIFHLNSLFGLIEFDEYSENSLFLCRFDLDSPLYYLIFY